MPNIIFMKFCPPRMTSSYCPIPIYFITSSLTKLTPQCPDPNNWESVIAKDIKRGVLEVLTRHGQTFLTKEKECCLQLKKAWSQFCSCE